VSHPLKVTVASSSSSSSSSHLQQRLAALDAEGLESSAQLSQRLVRLEGLRGAAGEEPRQSIVADVKELERRIDGERRCDGDADVICQAREGQVEAAEAAVRGAERRPEHLRRAAEVDAVHGRVHDPPPAQRLEERDRELVALRLVVVWQPLRRGRGGHSSMGSTPGRSRGSPRRQRLPVQSDDGGRGGRQATGREVFATRQTVARQGELFDDPSVDQGTQGDEPSADNPTVV